MREYDEYMLYTYKYHRRNVEKQRGKGMLGRCYEIISEMASRSSNRKYAQRPHSGLPNKEDMIVRNSNRSPSGLYAVLTAPSACLRSFIDKIKYANRYGRKLASGLRRKKRNGN